MTAKKSAKRNAEEITPDESGRPEEDLEEPATEDRKPPKAKKPRVHLVRAYPRKCWQVRVFDVPEGMPAEKNRRFSYGDASGRKGEAAVNKAFEEAKDHCIMLCGRIGAALPQICK